jgi:uncharacterized membrane protein YeaQ/YmgE (transglycosylase-associated protein family)
MTIVTVMLDVTLQPESLLVWLVVGVIAGFLASRVMWGAYGLLGDLIIGLAGAVLGGFLADLLGLGATNLLAASSLPSLGPACSSPSSVLSLEREYVHAGGVVDKSKQHTWLSFTVRTSG